MKRYSPTTDIINAIFALDSGDKIRAYFTDGREGVYSGYMIDLLKTDENVRCITSETTGEVIYNN